MKIKWLELTSLAVTIVISVICAGWAVNSAVSTKFIGIGKAIDNHEIRIVKLELKYDENKKAISQLLENSVSQGKILGKMQSALILLLKKNDISTEILSRHDSGFDRDCFKDLFGNIVNDEGIRYIMLR